MFERKFIFASAVTVLNTRNTYYVNKLRYKVRQDKITSSHLVMMDVETA